MHAGAASGRSTRWSLPIAALVVALVGFLLSVTALTVGLTSTATVCGATPAPGAISGDARALPAGFLPYFAGAAARFALGSSGWAYLAAINAVESDFDDRSLPGVASGANPFGAAGPMQIGVGGEAGDTWDRVEVDGVPGGASPPSVYDEADAVYAAANLLRGAGAPRDWAGALFAYNHADTYVHEVGALAARYATLGGVGASGDCTAVLVAQPVIAGQAPALLADGEAAVPEGAPAPVRAMLAAGNLIIDQRYSYGGGHSPASMGIPPDPAADPGDEENGGPGYDCSSAVDYVLWGAGMGRSLLGGAVPASEQLAGVGDAGIGRWVTIYAGSSGGQAHAFIAVDGLVLDTVHLEPTAPAGTGPRWQPPGEVARELAAGAFVARHPPGL
jgi:hypothetical protein